MGDQRSIAALLALALAIAPAAATGSEQTLPAQPIVMQGPELIATFDGKTANGAYGDGTPVRETYLVGGAITYWDPNWGNKTGKWSVINNLFCTFYDGMSGGCFRVERIGANCFDFFAVAGSEDEALQPGPRKDYTARVSLEGTKSTCPDELSV
jgi:hypothetical protein